MQKLPEAIRLVITILLCYTSNAVHAQGHWAIFSHKVDVAKYQGLRYKVQAIARAEYTDDSAVARLWAKAETPTEKAYSYFENMIRKRITTKEWKTYVVDGKVDSGAVQLAFGALCMYNGRLYLDDLKVEIELANGRWQQIFSSDFEDGKNGFIAGIEGLTLFPTPFFTAGVSKGLNLKETRHLVIVGKDVPIYGINTRAGKFAEVNGIRLYYEVYGDGPPLLVLHGNGGSIENASDFYPDLIKKYKIIAVDSRSQGKSTDTEAPLTYEQMASDVNALLEKLDIDSALIWGQSDGAILGLLLAMDYPKRVKKVVAFGANIQPDSLAIFPWMIEGIRKVLSESKDVKERKLNQLMLDHPRIPYSSLSRIKIPVLVVAGDRDAIRPEHTLKIFQNIPNSQMSIIPGATHGAAWEQKEYFLKMMTDFFDKPFNMPDTKSWFN